MLQDLKEYLEENPNIAVAPEWSETVQKSVRNVLSFVVKTKLFNVFNYVVY